LKKKWSQIAHETWQVDGKERVKLGNGEEVSWMNIGDEGTGAHLSIFVDEHRTVSGMDASIATQRINKSFERWGLPKSIKVDNGHPFVNPNGRDSPTKAILWWVGLGIEVIQNTPRCPQQNGIVESLQGTMCRWSNPKGQQDIGSLEKRLNEESDFQRNHYQIRSRNNKTRIELYPELENNDRLYDSNEFDMKLVYKYLSKKILKRRVGTNGVVKFLKQQICIGSQYFGLSVTITFDPIEIQWMIRKEDGTLLKTTTRGVPLEKEIVDFALGRK